MNFYVVCAEYLVQVIGISLSLLYNLHVHVGQHACLWCEVTRDQLSIVPHDLIHTATLRSLQSPEQIYNQFLTQGRNDIPKAKLYRNVIGKSFFPVSLKQVNVHVTMTHT